MKTMFKLFVAATVLSGCTSLELSTEATAEGNAPAGGSQPILEQMAKDSAGG
jgi:uncharacterized protein YceK